MYISLLNVYVDHLLESSHRDDSNKWSNIEFGEEIPQEGLVKLFLRTLSLALSVNDVLEMQEKAYANNLESNITCL